jgi:hypothetical protein
VIDAFDLAGRDLIGEHHRKGSEAGAPTPRNPPVRFSFPPRPLPTAEPLPPIRRQRFPSISWLILADSFVRITSCQAESARCRWMLVRLDRPVGL